MILSQVAPVGRSWQSNQGDATSRCSPRTLLRSSRQRIGPSSRPSRAGCTRRVCGAQCVWWSGARVSVDASSYSVEATTIDHLVVEHALDRLDFVKIDVEGHESDVLFGAADTIGRHNQSSSSSSTCGLSPHSLETTHFGSCASFSRLSSMSRGATGRFSTTDSGRRRAFFIHDSMTTGGCVHNLALRKKAEGFPDSRTNDGRRLSELGGVPANEGDVVDRPHWWRRLHHGLGRDRRCAGAGRTYDGDAKADSRQHS